MTIDINQYNPDNDYERVWQFLVDIYIPGDSFLNWLPPRWEYMHHHPFIWELDLTQIGIFENSEEIVGVVHPESNSRICHFQIRPGYEYLKPQMFDYFEKTFVVLDIHNQA